MDYKLSTTWSAAWSCLDSFKKLMWSVIRDRMVDAIEETFLIFLKLLSKHKHEFCNTKMSAVSTWLGHLSYKVRMSPIQLVICWKCAIVIRVLLLQWYLFIVRQYLDISIQTL